MVGERRNNMELNFIIRNVSHQPTFVVPKTDVSSHLQNFETTVTSGTGTLDSNLHQTGVKMDYEKNLMTPEPRGSMRRRGSQTNFTIKLNRELRVPASIRMKFDNQDKTSSDPCNMSHNENHLINA